VKKAKHIFVTLFLMVMLFTVFQYIPLIEEENSADVELSKKNTENNETENDTDADEDNAGDFYNHHLSYNFDNSFALKFFSNQKAQSLIEFKEINTPPPKTA
jgi:hypothetical protein